MGRSRELLESFAYRALSLSAHRALSRIEVEWCKHSGKDNGKLPVTFDDFVDYGVHRSAVGPALAELEALGFIEITERGKMAQAAEYRRPNKFRLRTREELEGVGVGGCQWRRFKTLDEAEDVATDARKRSVEKKKPPVRKTYQSTDVSTTENVPLALVRKPYH